MDGVDLLSEVYQGLEDAHAALEAFKKSGVELAEAERQYRCSLKTKEAYYRAHGYPATLNADLSRGSADVADLRFQRDLKEVEHKADYETLLLAKIKIKVFERLNAQEWSMSGGKYEQA